MGRRVIRQFGALPYRLDDRGLLEILLVTSRETGRWVVPKGNPMPRRRPHETAAREAYEEAGVEGEIGETPLGSFRYRKRSWLLLPVMAEVRLFPLRVERLLDSWPEARQRKRQWFKRAEAAALVKERQLRQLILGFEPEAAISTPPR